MKISRVLALMVCLSAAFVAGCDGSDGGFDTPDNTIPPGEVIDPASSGYISFESAVLTVDAEDEEFADKQSGDYESFDTANVGSRTDATQTAVELDDYLVVIKNSEGATSYSGTYGEAKALTSPIKLAAGVYTVQVMSEATTPLTAWNYRVYASAAEEYTIGNENITSIGDIVCYLTSIKTQIALSADMADEFKKDGELGVDETPFSVTLDYGDSSLVYDFDRLYDADATDAENAANTGYIAADSQYTTLAVTLRGTYNAAAASEPDNYVDIVWTQTITGVKAAQARMITIKIDNFGEGKIQINLTVQSWSYDSPLGVDISQTFMVVAEDKISDPDDEKTDINSPVVSLYGGLDIEDTYIIDSNTFSEEAESYYPFYKAFVTPSEGSSVSSVDVVVDSTSSYLLESIESDFGSTTIPFWGAGVANSALSDYVAIAEDSESGAVTATLKYAGVKMLYNYVGTHTFKIIAKDNLNRYSYTTLTIEVQSSAGAAITWVGGDFSLRYDISDGCVYPDMKFIVTSSTGIKTLSVDIDSEILTPNELASVSLSTHLDLANPGDYEAAIKGFGLPVGKEVLNAKSVTIDITKFMALIAQISYPEYKTTDFLITVKDATSEASETLMVTSANN